MAWRRRHLSIISAAASPATAPMHAGWCRISRRCSTTTPCSSSSSALHCRVQPGRCATATASRRRSAGCCASSAARRRLRRRASTPIRKARRAASMSGAASRARQRARAGRCGFHRRSLRHHAGWQFRGTLDPQPPRLNAAAWRSRRRPAEAACSPRCSMRGNPCATRPRRPGRSPTGTAMRSRASRPPASSSVARTGSSQPRKPTPSSPKRWPKMVAPPMSGVAGRRGVAALSTDLASLAPRGARLAISATGAAGWVTEADRLLALLERHHGDGNGSFALTPDDGEALIVRRKSVSTRRRRTRMAWRRRRMCGSGR